MTIPATSVLLIAVVTIISTTPYLVQSRTDNNRIFSSRTDTTVQRSDGFTFTLRTSFFLNGNTSVQLSPCHRRLSLSSNGAQLSLFRPKVDEISLLTVNSSSFQLDHTRGSGCSDLNVMKVALKEFKEKYPSGFQHVEAWEVVRKHDKWAQVPLLGEEGEGPAQKRKPVEVDPSIPDMSEDPSPQRTQRRDKVQATSSEGSAELAAQFKEYTAMKEAKHAIELEAIELRKKRESEARELITEQRETMRNYVHDRDMKTFLKPHDDVPPEMLPFILARKREIANKYGWPCNF